MAERKARGVVADAPPPPVIEVTIRVKARVKYASDRPRTREQVVKSIIGEMRDFGTSVQGTTYKLEAVEVVPVTDERVTDESPADAPKAP